MVCNSVDNNVRPSVLAGYKEKAIIMGMMRGL